jgi:uncharacterized protein (TIGR03437 family)
MAIQLSRLALLRDARPCHNDAARGAFIVAAFFLAAGPVARAQSGYLTYPTGLSPQGVTAADLNGDRLPDLVIANSGSNTLTVLLNSTSGVFTSLPPISLPTSPANLAPNMTIAADLNGDRKIDLVVLGYGGLAVLLGNGDGTFQPPLPVSNLLPYTVQVADLNGDGIPDLAVTVPIGGGFIPVGATLGILTGKGDGTFSNGPVYGLGFTPWAALTIGDFNHDGAPDIAVVSESAVTIFLNDGKGNFTAVVSGGEPWDFAPGIVAADFNGDGLLDLAVTFQTVNGQASGSTAILLGRGDGTFQTGSSFQTASPFSQIVAMDLNGDSHVDLAEGIPVLPIDTGAAGLVFFAGRGDGTFQSGYPFGGSGSTGYMAIADFTGSGAMGFAVDYAFLTPASVPSSGNTVILPRAVWPSLALASTSSAGLGLGPLAAGSIATAFGSGLATQTAEATTPQASLGGATVSVTDSAGAVRPAPLLYVSPGQVNYVIPAGTAPGLATVGITANGSVTATGQIDVVPVAPALFTLNADNLAAAYVVLVSQDGDQTYAPIYQTDQNANVTALPIDLGSASDTAYLVLYGTGIRNLAGTIPATATIGWAFNARVTYAGPAGVNGADGLDQVNLQLPGALAAATAYPTTLQLTVDGQPSNSVTLWIQ